MTAPPPETTVTRPAHDGPLNPAQVRWLIVAIVVMGILIVLGVFGVIARMFYLSSVAPKAPERTTVSSPALTAEGRIQVPAGAVVRSLALDGDRLAIYFDGPAGSGVRIVSIATGRVVARWSLEPEPPR